MSSKSLTNCESNATSSSQHSSFDNGSANLLKNVVNHDLSTVWVNNNKKYWFCSKIFC